MRYVRFRISSILVGVMLLLGIVSVMPGLTQSVAAQGGDSKSQAEAGITAAGGAASGPTLETIIRNIVLLLSWVVGIAAVIMVLLSGFKYLTSGGDAGSIQSAKNTLLYAIVGLVIAIFAQVIVRFVIGRVGGGAGGEGGGGGEGEGGETTLLLQTLFS